MGRVGGWLAIAILATLIVVVLVVPVVLRGESPSPLELLVASGELVVIGLLLRTRPSERVRSIGFAVLLVGLVALAASLILLWVVVNGRGL